MMKMIPNYDQMAYEKVILELLNEKPHTTKELRTKIIAWDGEIYFAQSFLYRKGYITMIKQERKFPYTITEKGVIYLTQLNTMSLFEVQII